MIIIRIIYITETKNRVRVRVIIYTVWISLQPRFSQMETNHTLWIISDHPNLGEEPGFEQFKSTTADVVLLSDIPTGLKAKVIFNSTKILYSP